jgi:glycosyltransferase involved in cell wall biosynthesis
VITSPRYSVVVPAFDEESLLPGTLAALREAMAAVPHAGEVIVCDNNSTDRTAEVARAGGARVVFEPRNQIARARNAGAREAAGEWLVFVDADTRVPPALLREALDLLASGRACGGGARIRFEGATGRFGRTIVAAWDRISRRLRLAAGSFVFVRRDAFTESGGFPETVYAGEEVWLSLALKRWGRRRGMPFVRAESAPATTSARKLEWFSAWALAGTLLLMTLCPPLARSRRFCRIWYARPGRGRPAA